MKVALAILILWLFVGTIYHIAVTEELKTELHIEQQLNQACTGELLWRDMQIKDLKVSQ